MKRHVAEGFCFVVIVELLTLFAPDRGFILRISGTAMALVIFSIRRLITLDVGSEQAEPNTDALSESLRSWVSRTETLLHWSESTRSDWDRHLRPMLARRFEMATGQRRAKDPATFDATGRMLFGEQMWAWVDQENIARAGGREPGPGRGVLEEILQRLEQV
jgi:hypothetical protein